MTASGERATSALLGTLEERPLGLLLSSASERDVTGILTLSHERAIHRLALRRGRITMVWTQAPVARLGAVLVDLGMVGRRAIDDALAVSTSERRLLGEVLVARGDLDRSRLDSALVEQTYRKAEHLFALPAQARWSFRQTDVSSDIAPARDEERLPADTWCAVWRGLRAHAPTEHLTRTLASLEGRVHLRDPALLDRFGFTPAERAIGEELALSPGSITETACRSPLGVERARRVLYQLAITRCLVRAHVEAPGPAELGAARVRRRALEIGNQDAHTVLGVPPGAPAEAVRAAYFRLARLWHPARLPDEHEALRPDCETILEHLTEAHRVLTEGTRAAMPSIAPARGSMVPARGSIAPARGSMAPVPPRGSMAPARSVPPPRLLRSVPPARERSVPPPGSQAPPGSVPPRAHLRLAQSLPDDE